MKKRIVLFIIVFTICAGLAIADDILIPGRPMNTPWYQQLFQFFERVFQLV